METAPGSSRRDLDGFSLLFGLSEGIGAVVVILMAIWLGNYRGGFAWHSNVQLEFNWHPLLMTLSMVFLYGNGIMMFRSLRYRRKRQLKLLHAACHILTFVLVVIGLQAVFDSHNLADPPIPNLYTLHSWVGLTSVILFCCQFFAGLTAFLWPGTKLSLRGAYMPIHRFFGMAGFIFAVAAALMGLLEKAHWVIKDYQTLSSEGLLVNFIGILLMTFASLVMYVVTTDSYKRLALAEDEMLLASGGLVE
ncbi:hypothetical protein B566_EDAN008252 [Ephemera danica]|nr:hypothetical protein B566_EDAN008252 [Ephemera danica]